MNRTGDMICTLPLIKTLRNEYPEAQITVLAETANAEIIKYEPYIDSVLVYERDTGIFKRRCLNLKMALSGNVFDLAIGVKGGFSSFLATAAVLSGARFRIGYVSRKRRLFDRFYNLPVKPIDFLSIHQVDACLNLLKPIGVRKEIKDITISIPSIFKDEALNFLNSNKLKPNNRLIIFNISNTKENSSWSPDKFIKLARFFIQRHQCKCIITGIPSDEHRALMICKQIGDGAYFFKTVNIMNFAAITPMCNLLVTGEGGAGHVGAASGCLVISLFGEAEPAIWRPYGEKHISLKARNCEVNSITVENVISTIESNEQISIDMNLHGRG